jgi:hypothetical protein
MIIGENKMDMKIGFSILFGLPTILLAFIYYYLGVDNYWQLFLFSSMVLIAYLPGILLLHLVYTCHMRNKINNNIGDFGISKE